VAGRGTRSRQRQDIEASPRQAAGNALAYPVQIDLAAHPFSNPFHCTSSCHELAEDGPRHGLHYLPLLPPGPDGVRNRLLRGARPGTAFGTWSHGPSKGNSAPHKRISGYRTPLASRLAQPSNALIAYRGGLCNGKTRSRPFSLDLTPLKNLIFQHRATRFGAFAKGVVSPPRRLSLAHARHSGRATAWV
jgi:hypothetical protein